MTLPNTTDQKIQKSFPAFISDTKAEGDLGIVSAFVSVMGNIDHHGEVIVNGAFKKTIAERFSKIRILDNHNFWSAEDAIAKLITIREVGRAELPPELLAKFPDATGGLYIECQFMLDEPTDKSARIFRRIKAGLIDEYSIGFSIIKADWREIDTDMGKQQIRFITEIKLYEFSPVIFAANDATVTVDAKGDNPEFGQEIDAQEGWIEIELIPHSKAISGYEQSVGDDRCMNCKFYAAVTEKTGFCKQHEEAVKDKYVCDTYEKAKELITVGSTLKSSFDEFMSKRIEHYSKLGIMTDDDMARLNELVPVVIDTLLTLMPEDILGREIPSQEYTMPKSDDPEAEPNENSLTSVDAKQTQLAIQRSIAELKAMQLRSNKQ